MIIDCHAHYEPRLLPDDALLAQMDQSKIDKMVLIPLLTNPPEGKKPDILMKIQRFMYCSNLLRPLGIFITKSMYKQDGQWNNWLGGGKKEENTYNIVLRPDNDMVHSLIERNPTRFMAWILINPHDPDHMQEFEKFEKKSTTVGIKLHPFWHKFAIKQAEPILERAQEAGLPVCFHLGFDEGGDYEWVVNRFPDLKIIFSHLGVPYYKEVWKAVGARPNVFFDISSTYHVSRSLVKQAVKTLGADKIMYGTDCPYSHDDVIPRIKKWVDELDISQQEKDMIFRDNFHRVIGR